MSTSHQLTAIAVDRLKPRSTRYEVADHRVPGLRLVVQPTGAKSWVLRYSIGNRDRRYTIGSYPTLGLDSARKRASVAKAAIAAGRDPGAEKIEARRKAAAGIDRAELVAVVWEEYRDQHLATRRKATKDAATNTFTKWALPKIGKYRIGEVTKRDILGILDSVMKAGYPAAASRARAVLTAFFNWAIARDIIAASPCLGIKPPAETRSRDRVLSDDELRWLWTACEQDPFPFGRMVQLLILTGARRDEVRRITDKELKRADGLWVLPASRAKNRRAHEVPLSDAALAVIDTAPRVRNRAGYVFCTNGKTPSSGFSRMKRRLDRDMLKIAREEAKARGEDSQKVKIPEWVLHDLRRTAASGMARLGIALPVIERCLNHVSGSFAGIVGVYQKHSYIEEKKTALDTWARFVMSLTEPAAENVLPFKQAAK